MTREEIIKIFEENHIAEGNATINATKLAEIFTKHETDLLKEFVEFAKGEFIKANYCYNDTYLDTMLDMFLEERK